MEHAFQAAKTDYAAGRARIRDAATPGKAKSLGRRVKLRPDWEKVKVGIMHKILRKKFDEPRIHMALVCAARSCPRLRDEPFDGARLDGQLDDQSLNFVAKAEQFRIDRPGGKVHLSSIFEWFGGDFVAKYAPKQGFADQKATVQAVLNFAAGQVSVEDAAFLRDGSYQVESIKYDWTLNERTRPPATKAASTATAPR